jgi:cysteine-rich repeat protein
LPEARQSQGGEQKELTMWKVAVRPLALVALMWVVPACIAGEGTVRSNSEGSDEDCTLTQGYWKNHEEAWPVDSLALGNVIYSKAALLAILDQPVQGNGLISLSHQLIAAKLNLASGAPDAIVGAIADADAMIGDLMCPPIGDGYLATSATSGLAGALADFNEGDTGPGHCGDTPPPEPACGDGVLDAGEQCDDGNTTDGDGCSATCILEVEPPPHDCATADFHTQVLHR